MNIEINEESIVKCPWCSRKIKAEQWNDTTLSECKSREMKRAFKPIYNTQVWGSRSDNFYKCPSCNSWSKGDQLTLIDNEGETVRQIGGKQVMKILDRGRHE